MIAVAVICLQFASVLGLGISLLRFFGIKDDLQNAERLTWAFVLGIGALGWVMFFLGMANLFYAGPLAALLVAGLPGLVFFKDQPTGHVLKRTDPDSSSQSQFSWLFWVLAGALALVLIFDLVEALAPPADADTMAYHFAIPKNFLREGGIYFIPRVTDGAIPLLLHMTFIPPMALGGELAANLWAGLTGWMVAALLYTGCRRYLSVPASLAVAVIFLTTPAVIYGGGTGQMETRNGLFTVVAALSVAIAREKNNLRYAAIAGLAIGFFFGAKMTGLLFAVAAGLVILLQRRGFLHGAFMTIVALCAGSQWFVWNFLNTGDPFFPMLFGVLDYMDHEIWDREHHQQLMSKIIPGEDGVPRNVFWYLAYPFVATLAGLREFESGRTGLGPSLMLILPFALAGSWAFRTRLKTSRLTTITAIVVIFYSLWFFIGFSQRVRHMLPVYPLALALLCIVAVKWAQLSHQAAPLAMAFALTLAFQISAHGLFSYKFARYLLFDQSREEYLTLNLPGYPAIAWINTHLKQANKVLLYKRWLNYYLDIPYYYAHVYVEAKVNVLPGTRDAKKYLAQLRSLQITHLFVWAGKPGQGASGRYLWKKLHEAGCLSEVQTFKIETYGSRTLPSKKATIATEKLYALKETGCQI